MDSLRKPYSEIAKEKLKRESQEKEADFELKRNRREKEIIRRETAGESRESLLQTPTGQGASAVGAPGIDATKSPLHQTVEAILEDNLEDLYFSLDVGAQDKFKKKGEETTVKIMQLITSAKATFKKIFKLIFKWLKIIPGVNRYFLEQEAKIKADRIMEIKF